MYFIFIILSNITLNKYLFFFFSYIYFSLYLSFLKFKYTLLIHFKKIKYTGKGYRIFFKKKYFIFNFGFSHFLIFYIFNIFIISLTKLKFFFYGLNFFNLNSILALFKNIRYINIFTHKGVRLFKQILFKKVGKLSLYI